MLSLSCYLKPSVLHSVEVTVTTNDQCAQAYGNNIGE